MKNRKNVDRLLEQIQQHLGSASDLPESSATHLESKLQEALTILSTKKSKISSDSNSTIQIWSDGACSGNPGPGGWGTIIYHNGEYQELSGSRSETTNNVMEMTGALEGIRNTPEGSRIVLTSDSQYLVKGMTQWIKGWKRKNWIKADGKPVLNKSVWQDLDQEASRREVLWKWVKGHAGHPQNERCDELARLEIVKLNGY